MKFLVLGATGMAGHMIAIYLCEQGHHVTTYSRTAFPYGNNIVGDITDRQFLQALLATTDADIVVNCIGMLNNACEQYPAKSIFLNSYLPHAIAAHLKDRETRLIQLSTDCVFSGKAAPYYEQSTRDGETFYDRTKGLGEIDNNKHLTFRNSIIYLIYKRMASGCLIGLCKEDGSINGYTGALWTGVTTLTLAKAIEQVAKEGLTGLYHLVHTTNISKYDLLQLLNQYFRNNTINILPDPLINVDKTLINTRHDFSFVVPSYQAMIVEMKDWMLQHKNLYPHYHKRHDIY